MWGRFRNYLYDRGYLDIEYTSAFVLSVGNLTWGGTGKTALSAQIAANLISSGYQVAVVSRGYKRKSEGLRVVSDGKELQQSWQDAGDEAYWLAKQVPQAIVIVAEDRREALHLLANKPPDVVLLDDGFQNRRIARDLDLVLVDASENLLHQRVIPFGKLREPIDSLKRADALILTHSKIAQPDTVEWIASHINCPIFHANYVPIQTEFVDPDEQTNPAKFMKWSGKKLAAFCALGAPHHFFRMLQENGAELVLKKSYRDHHAYTNEDLQELQAEAIISRAEALITTEKDALKLPRTSLPLIVVHAELKIEEDTFPEFIQERILERISQRSSA